MQREEPVDLPVLLQDYRRYVPLLMKKPEIAHKLAESHLAFTEFILNLSDQELMQSNQQKWSAGQQLDHICRSIRPVQVAMKLPGFMLRLLFGKAKRPGMDYKELVQEYHKRLEESGGGAFGQFLPRPVEVSSKLSLSHSLLSMVQDIVRRLDNYTEEELDTYVVPHPYLGKITLREAMYFTIHHVKHHFRTTKENLGGMV